MTTAWWPWAAGAAVLLAGLGAWALRRRRHRAQAYDGETPSQPTPETPAVPKPASVVSSPVEAPAPATCQPALLTRMPAPAARPWLELDVHPRRGGVNLLSLAVELDITVRNTGEAAAESVLIEVTLLPARTGQDAELAALFARAVARPVVPAFALEPAEERRARIVTALPLTGVEPLVARGRSMLVPVIAINAVYRWAAAEAGQTAGTIVVGVENEGREELAPFWLDTPRMHDRLAARPYMLTIRR